MIFVFNEHIVTPFALMEREMCKSDEWLVSSDQWGESEMRGDGCLKMAGTITAEGAVDVFETLDEIADLVAWGGTSGCFAEMCATAEWSGFVNLAAALFQKRTSSFGIVRHLLATTSAPGLCGDHRFATGKVRRFSRELETTTSGASDAVAAEIARGQFLINATHLLQQSRRISSLRRTLTALLFFFAHGEEGDLMLGDEAIETRQILATCGEDFWCWHFSGSE